jgi:ParB/RepB/Spo0J family partition protein
MKNNVNIQTLPVDQIRPNPWNPNKQTDFIYERERHSIRTHGFLDPLLVRQKDGFVEIIDGEHRWRAARQEGLTELPVNNIGEVSDEVAQQLTIIMNETRGEADAKKLAELVASINTTVALEELEKALPYTLDQLQNMVAEVKVDWDKITPALPSPEKNEDQREEGYIIFQVKLPNEDHQQLIHQINRIKLQMAPGEDPSGVSTAGAIKAMLQHIITIPDDRLLRS